MPKHEDELGTMDKARIVLDQMGLRPIDLAFICGFVLASAVCVAALGPWS